MALALAAEAGRDGSFERRVRGSTRPDVVEFFGGTMGITQQGLKQGWHCMQPYDILYGVNLRDARQREQALADLDRWRPRLAVVQFPCRLWRARSPT